MYIFTYGFFKDAIYRKNVKTITLLCNNQTSFMLAAAVQGVSNRQLIPFHFTEDNAKKYGGAFFFLLHVHQTLDICFKSSL